MDLVAEGGFPHDAQASRGASEPAASAAGMKSTKKGSRVQREGIDARPLLRDAHLLDLRAFILVVERGSITAAARVLGEPKSTVSRRRVRLERALGAALVRRGARSVLPTDEGVVFREGAVAGLKLLDQAAYDVVRW